jgi:hypothetical protein
MKKTLSLTLGSLLLVAATAIPSLANVLATSTRTTADVFSDNLSHFVPLDNAGTTMIPFVTVANNTKVVITYNAECSVKGPVAGSVNANFAWLDLDILVDGGAAPPSSDDNAFCTDHGNHLLANWVSAATTVVYTVPLAGVHWVRVRGTLRNFDAGDQWRLDDSATIVAQ